MIKRTLGLLLCATLIGGVLSALPAIAQPTVPENPNITDPAGDANYLNATGPNQTTPQDASGIADLLKVWFTNDGSSLNVHIQTEQAFAPAANGTGYRFDVFVTTSGGAANCLRFRVDFARTTWAAPPAGSNTTLRDACGAEPVTADGQVVVDPLEGGSGIITMTFPRSASPGLADGSTLAAPYAEVRNLVGAGGSGLVPRIENTVVGTDYTISGGGEAQPSPSPTPTAGEEQPEEPKEKKCPKKKGKKGKKKKKCPKKPPEEAPPAACPTFTPGEQGAEAETSVVTDAATEEAPVEVEIPTDAGFGIGGTPLEATISHAFHNIQVDSSNPTAGLYVVLEFDLEEDYDLYLNYPDGSEAAHAAGFNPVPPLSDGTGSGGHSEMGAEFLDGVSTADCVGYTLDIANATGLGGDRTLKLWLGEVQYTPGGEAVMAAIDQLV